MRGKHLRTEFPREADGITPAGAGKTHSRWVQTPRCTDHPRRCGENARSSRQARFETGSPPQVRGKPEIPHCYYITAGITPAGAGKTHANAAPWADAEDHPRRCGENRWVQPPNTRCSGSPPQVRGKRETTVWRYLTWRITPAGAGKTGGCSHNSRAHEDHPRRCGENDESAVLDAINTGSPPQVRGKPF